MEKIQIGTIVNAVGIKGEVKVYSYSDQKERYERLAFVRLSDGEYKIEKVRYSKELIILKLSGIDDRNAAERLKGQGIFITEAELEDLPQDTYYVRDLIGLSVIDGEGNVLGRLCDVIKNQAQDLYEVEDCDLRKFWIPAVEEFVKEINLDQGFVKVELIEGLLG